jgi:uncharacterized protein YyaL (SSP411 family)
MLYDNAQLISLYSDAYSNSKNPLYQDIVFETLAFIEREMMTDNGAFYSSYDADSENSKGKLEEGAYYVWQKEDLKLILKKDFDLFSDYYNINNYGLWEHNNYVLIRKDDDETILKKYNLSPDELAKKKKDWKQTLSNLRNTRPKPRLDDKTLTSWNALMLTGYVDAYKAFGNKHYLDVAVKNAEFIMSNQHREDGGLYHSYKNGKSTINGYLEDYATTIEAFLDLYEQTLDDKWLFTARDLANYTFDHFQDDTSKLFYFTSDEDANLVSRTIEYSDNVIPASNSIMAKNLLKLSHYFDNEAYAENAKIMLHNVVPEIAEYPSTFSNWLDLMLNYTHNYYEVAIVGTDVKTKIKELNTQYLPNKLIVGSKTDNNLPLLKNRYVAGKTLIYVCVNKACKLPVSEVDKAIKFIKN